MGIKEQFVVIKKNWLIIILVLAVFLFFFGGSNIIENSLGITKSMGQSFGGGYNDNSSF